MNVVLLCAGMGKRLMPLTKNKPKSLVEVNNKPVIEYTLDNLIDLGFTELILVVGYRGEQLEHYILNKYIPNKNFKGTIRFIRQIKLNGTATAVYMSKQYISNGDFIVLSGDTIYNKKDIKELSKKSNTILYTEMKDNRNQYGTLKMDGNKILHINEKQKRFKSNNINCGAYHLGYAIYEYILQTPENKRIKERTITDSINLMIDEGYVFSGIFSNELCDISTPLDVDRLENQINLSLSAKKSTSKTCFGGG